MLMFATQLLLLIKDRDDPLGFTLPFAAVIFSILALVILWYRRYRRIWQQCRARNWREVSAHFDDGEIVTMRKGSSKRIAGYQVWMGYDYAADGEQYGLYTLPFSGEFPSEEVAERCRRLVANQEIAVRVSPRNPKHSRVMDQDVRRLLGEPL